MKILQNLLIFKIKIISSGNNNKFNNKMMVIFRESLEELKFKHRFKKKIKIQLKMIAAEMKRKIIRFLIAQVFKDINFQSKISKIIFLSLRFQIIYKMSKINLITLIFKIITK